MGRVDACGCGASREPKRRPSASPASTAASIGWHPHDRTEEIYYLLSGNLTVTVQDRDGRVHVLTLDPGDAHRIGTDMWHGAVAGPHGARFLCVMLGTRTTTDERS